MFNQTPSATNYYSAQSQQRHWTSGGSGQYPHHTLNAFAPKQQRPSFLPAQQPRPSFTPTKEIAISPAMVSPRMDGNKTSARGPHTEIQQFLGGDITNSVIENIPPTRPGQSAKIAPANTTTTTPQISAVPTDLGGNITDMMKALSLNMTESCLTSQDVQRGSTQNLRQPNNANPFPNCVVLDQGEISVMFLDVPDQEKPSSGLSSQHENDEPNENKERSRDSPHQHFDMTIIDQMMKEYYKDMECFAEKEKFYEETIQDLRDKCAKGDKENQRLRSANTDLEAQLKSLTAKYEESMSLLTSKDEVIKKLMKHHHKSLVGSQENDANFRTCPTSSRPVLDENTQDPKTFTNWLIKKGQSTRISSGILTPKVWTRENVTSPVYRGSVNLKERDTCDRKLKEEKFNLSQIETPSLSARFTKQGKASILRSNKLEKLEMTMDTLGDRTNNEITIEDEKEQKLKKENAKLWDLVHLYQREFARRKSISTEVVVPKVVEA